MSPFDQLAVLNVIVFIAGFMSGLLNINVDHPHASSQHSSQHLSGFTLEYTVDCALFTGAQMLSEPSYTPLPTSVRSPVRVTPHHTMCLIIKPHPRFLNTMGHRESDPITAPHSEYLPTTSPQVSIVTPRSMNLTPPSEKYPNLLLSLEEIYPQDLDNIVDPCGISTESKPTSGLKEFPTKSASTNFGVGHSLTEYVPSSELGLPPKGDKIVGRGQISNKLEGRQRHMHEPVLVDSYQQQVVQQNQTEPSFDLPDFTSLSSIESLGAREVLPLTSSINNPAALETTFDVGDDRGSTLKQLPDVSTPSPESVRYSKESCRKSAVISKELLKPDVDISRMFCLPGKYQGDMPDLNGASLSIVFCHEQKQDSFNDMMTDTSAVISCMGVAISLSLLLLLNLCCCGTGRDTTEVRRPLVERHQCPKTNKSLIWTLCSVTIQIMFPSRTAFFVQILTIIFIPQAVPWILVLFMLLLWDTRGNHLYQSLISNIYKPSIRSTSTRVQRLIPAPSSKVMAMGSLFSTALAFATHNLLTSGYPLPEVLMKFVFTVLLWLFIYYVNCYHGWFGGEGGDQPNQPVDEDATESDEAIKWSYFNGHDSMQWTSESPNEKERNNGIGSHVNAQVTLTSDEQKLCLVYHNGQDTIWETC